MNPRIKEKFDICLSLKISTKSKLVMTRYESNINFILQEFLRMINEVISKSNKNGIKCKLRTSIDDANPVEINVRKISSTCLKDALTKYAIVRIIEKLLSNEQVLLFLFSLKVLNDVVDEVRVKMNEMKEIQAQKQEESRNFFKENGFNPHFSMPSNTMLVDDNRKKVEELMANTLNMEQKTIFGPGKNANPYSEIDLLESFSDSSTKSQKTFEINKKMHPVMETFMSVNNISRTPAKLPNGFDTPKNSSGKCEMIGVKRRRDDEVIEIENEKKKVKVDFGECVKQLKEDFPFLKQTNASSSLHQMIGILTKFESKEDLSNYLTMFLDSGTLLVDVGENLRTCVSALKKDDGKIVKELLKRFENQKQKEVEKLVDIGKSFLEDLEKH